MKKLLLLGLAFAIVGSSFSQKRVAPPDRLKSIAVKKEISANENPRAENLAVPYKSTDLAPFEQQVGETWYDLQTNSTNQNRMYLYDDGTIGATWTMGFSPPGYAERGSGYNYFDGNEWLENPSLRIESMRSGWPSYIPLGENGEMVISHSGSDNGLVMNYRPDKGTGSWTEVLYPGPTGAEKILWPRAISTGPDNNIIHSLAVTEPSPDGAPYGGLDGALLYSRSQDGGQSWDIQNLILDELSSEHYTHFDGDSYDWAKPRGNTLAFVVSGNFNDCFLMKSTDNGDTWEKTLIWEHPYPMWLNEVTDTFFCMDGSIDVELDANEMAHLVFGINMTYSNGDGTFWYPYIDGVGYWNETMPAFSNNLNTFSIYEDEGSEMVENYNLIGWTQDINGDDSITFLGNDLDDIGLYYVGLSSMVQLVMGDQNQLYVVFSSTTELFDNAFQNYRRLWSRVSTDLGLSWGTFTNLTSEVPHLLHEVVYPSCADNTTESSIFLICQIDSEPGMSIAGDDPPDPAGSNQMVVMEVFKAEITGINDKPAQPLPPAVSQNSPNPFSGSTKIKVDIYQPAQMGLIVYNLVGQEVHRMPAYTANTGTHFLNINAQGLQSGVYFYTVTINDKRITHKMVVE